MIIGITGRYGAGKGAVVEILKEKGFIHFSARDLIKEECAVRGLIPDRQNLIDVANALRKEKAPYYIVEQLYHKAKSSNTNSIIESIRAVPEVEYLKSKKDFYLLAIDANQKLRYERIKKRKLATDHVTFEEFVKLETVESVSADPAKISLNECIKQADILIINDGSWDELKEKVSLILNKLENYS